MLPYSPYSYLIGWSSLDRWYYGVEYGHKTKTAHPSNLWTTYFSSSKIVCEQREQYGEPDIVQVRKIFNSSEEALRWEERVLRRLNVMHNERWLNRSYGGKAFRGMTKSGPEHHMYGVKRPDHSELMKTDRNYFKRHRFLGEENGFYGKTHSLETIEKIRKANSRPYEEKMDSETAFRVKSEHSQRMKTNNPFKGKKHSEETLKKLRGRIVTLETREKHRQNNINEQKLTCPHCMKITDCRNAKRWHFDNCKLKP